MKKYNWGIIGTGWIAHEMADALQASKGDVYAAANPNEDELKKSFPSIKESEYCDTIWNDVKTKVNKQMPAYKYIRRILISTEPIIKTTTQKIKRNEEIKKIKKHL